MQKFFIPLIVLISLPLSASAARFVIDAPPSVSSGSEASLRILVDTEGESANAYAGTLIISSGARVERIESGDSIATLWVERPQSGSSIAFSGITPGGFRGTGVIFRVVVQATHAFSVQLLHPQVLNNDGVGTSLHVSAPSARVALSSTKSEPVVLDDTVPPEQFSATIASSPELFGGASFVSFATQDKQSGIDHYEWTATYLLLPSDSLWQRTESPFVLSSLDEYKRIYIKAVDHAGNVRVITITPLPRARVLTLLFILLICCVFLGVARSRRSLSQ